MIRLLYNLLFPVALLFFMPGYAIKMMRRGNYRKNFGQRVGFYSSALRNDPSQRSWIHAVSVGEVAVALRLAAQLHREEPNFSCILTTTTTTGYAFAMSNAPSFMEVLYSPLDFWPVTRRAFRFILPRRIILIEAEIWPNMLGEARRRAVPVILANARLSPRSERRFRRVKWLIAPLFSKLDAVAVPFEADAERWWHLGVQRKRITVTGNIKYDIGETVVNERMPADAFAKMGIDRARPVLLGGSTHPGEEEILANAFCDLRKEFPSLLLVVAPRHVERCAQIRRDLEKLSLRVALKSAELVPAEQPDVLLLDATGELRHWYSVATVVFIGKSLSTTGGQNPVEPIVAGKPVIFGPNMQNFPALAHALVLNDAAVEVRDGETLRTAAAKLLRDPAARAAMVANAEQVLAVHHGATARTAAVVRETAPPK